MGDISKSNEDNKKPVLANRLLCFVSHDLSTTFKIPVAYFFTNCLKSKELYEILLQVWREVEAVGMIVTIIVIMYDIVANKSGIVKNCVIKWAVV